jgi:hypothetical protein
LHGVAGKTVPVPSSSFAGESKAKGEKQKVRGGGFHGPGYPGGILFVLSSLPPMQVMITAMLESPPPGKYLKSKKSVKHLPQSPFTGQF